MAAQKRKAIYITPEPDWKLLKQSATEEAKELAFKRADFFVHYEIENKAKSGSMKKWLKAHEKISKDDKKVLNSIPEWNFTALGKYTWIAGKLGFLPASIESHILNYIPIWLDAKPSLIGSDDGSEATAEKPKEEKKVVNIQTRMLEQVSNLCGDWEGKLDDMLSGAFALKDFDPYKEMLTYERGLIKANHAKIIKDSFAGSYEEAKAVVEWVDEDIKEGYAHLSTVMRRAFLQFFEKINTACDTFISTGKAQRKTRKPKAVSKERLTQKLKYQVNFGELGIASINPIEIIDARELWVYNTKNRKLGVYRADDVGPGLGVKGTTITGFLESKSVQKTLRKPKDQMKDFKGNARTKYAKAFDEIRSTETKMNGRINAQIILLKAF